MAFSPKTSATLLRDLTEGPDNPRWGEFVARYRSVMERFLGSHFPFLEKDDIIQETLLAFAKALPNYHYVPEEKGYFHNYLIGILRHKALQVLKREKYSGKIIKMYASDPLRKEEDDPEGEMDEAEWRKNLYEIALQQLLANSNISDRSKQVFIRTAMKGEKPEEVASSLAITRNSVDQTKWRMMKKLRLLIEGLKSVGSI